MIVNSIVKIKYRTQTCDIQSWERAYPKLWQIQSWTVQTCLNTSCRNISYLQLPWGWQVIFLSVPVCFGAELAGSSQECPTQSGETEPASDTQGKSEQGLRCKSVVHGCSAVAHHGEFACVLVMQNLKGNVFNNLQEPLKGWDRQ